MVKCSQVSKIWADVQKCLVFFLEIGYNFGQMTSFTKNAIKETFLNLVRRKPLSEITVDELAAACGVNRNTFYYHFRDMQALVEEILLDQVNEVLGKHPTLNSIEDCLYAILDIVRDNREVIIHIYNSLNRVVFEKFLWEVCYVLVENYWNNTVAEQPAISVQNRRLVMDYYAATCFGLAMKWMASGLDDKEARRDVRELCKIALREPERMLTL